ncbi:MAG: RrF2 family transcriptional regulator [Hyphomicrobiales bacterium]
MTLITPRKNQYALRAVFELAKHRGKGPTKISDIASAQSIPLRFLEVILNQLKGSGLIDAKRGFYGGYYLTRSPEQITVADIMAFMQGPVKPAQCAACKAKVKCPYGHRCAFMAMWNRVNHALSQVYTETTIQDLLDNDRQLQDKKRISRKRPSKTRQGRSL